MFSYKDCEEHGLLRKIPASQEKADGSIKAAEHWLNEARKGIDANSLSASIMSSYLAMFHAARSLLYFEGYREKSHYCIARFLENRYVNKKLLEDTWVKLLDYYRDIRHDDQYSTNFIATKEDTQTALSTANSFVNRMKKLLVDLKQKKLEDEKKKGEMNGTV